MVDILDQENLGKLGKGWSLAHYLCMRLMSAPITGSVGCMFDIDYGSDRVDRWFIRYERFDHRIEIHSINHTRRDQARHDALIAHGYDPVLGGIYARL